MASEEFIESTEVLSWLERHDGKERALAEDGSNRLADEALRLVRELYAAGAPQVLATDVVVDEDFEDAASLKVMLPKDQKAREALFVIEARALRDLDTPWNPEGERGQDFFILGW